MKLIRFIGIALCVITAMTSQMVYANTKSSKNTVSANLSKPIRLRMDVSLRRSGSAGAYAYSYTSESVVGNGSSVPMSILKSDYYAANSSAVIMISLYINGNLLPKIITDKSGHSTISVTGSGTVKCDTDGECSPTLKQHSVNKTFDLAVSLKPGETKIINTDGASIAGMTAVDNSLMITLTATIEDGLVEIPPKQTPILKKTNSKNSW